MNKVNKNKNILANLGNKLKFTLEFGLYISCVSTSENKKMVFKDEYILLIFLFIPILFLLLNSFKQNFSKKRQGSESTSVLRSYPFLGTLPDFIINRHRFLEWITDILNQTTPRNTIVLNSPPIMPDGVITSNPLNVEHMLKTNFDNYPKGERSHLMLKELLGDGIFNSDGDHWRMQRKTASVLFNKKSLRIFVMETVQFEIIQRLIPMLDASVEKGSVLDLQDVLQRFAFDNICKVAFNVDPAALFEEEEKRHHDHTAISENFMTAFDYSTEMIAKGRFFDPITFSWRVKRYLNIGSEKRLKESIKIVNKFALDIIRSRKSNPCSDDLLSHFAKKEDSTEESLRDVIVNFLLAGRQTTSSTLTWFFWLLLSNPSVELNILDEIRSIKAKKQDYNNSGMFDFEQLREMNYLHAAISESLRLYPAVPLDTQKARNNDVMPDGTYVKKGSFVTYSAYSMGRNESIWGSDCCEFKPERWLVDGVFQPENTFKFPVFHAGPRICLGKEMAYIQMKSIVACVLDKFEYMIVKKTPPELLLSLTLRMKDGLQVKFKRREC